jgi:hypothetical protein
MTKRAGVTEKLSISLNKSDADVLRKRAKRLYKGNLSAVIVEFAADARRLEAMVSLLGALGGPSMSDAERQALVAVWADVPKRSTSRAGEKSQTARSRFVAKKVA